MFTPGLGFPAFVTAGCYSHEPMVKMFLCDLFIKFISSMVQILYSAGNLLPSTPREVFTDLFPYI